MPFPYYENRCQNCGTVYKENDLYCSKCGAFLIKPEMREDALLNDIEKSKWCAYIEKKTERYMPIFEKNKDKKFFASPNIAAMLCGVFWLFYRKMYIEGLIYTAINFVLSLILSVLLLFSYQPELKTNVAIIEDFNAYIETLDADTKNLIYNFTIQSSNGNYEVIDSNLDSLPEGYIEKYQAAIVAQNNIKAVSSYLTAYGFFFTMIFSIVFGIFADCIYRNHIIKNRKYSFGGVSVPSIFVVLLMNVILNYVSGFISEILTKIII